MMKFFTLAAILALATPTLAQSGPPKVPTGIDVKGPTYYRMVPVMGGHRVQYQRELCDRRAIETRDPSCVYGSDRLGEQADPNTEKGSGQPK